MECKVCGRTAKEVKKEFGIDTEIKEHQNIMKCSKCIREYESEHGERKKSNDDRTFDDNWKGGIFV